MSLLDFIYEHTGISINYRPVLESEHLLCALAVLLRLGSADGDTDPLEVAGVVEIASRRFGDDSEVGIKKILEAFKETKERSLSDLLNELNSKLGLEQKEELLELAYHVARLDKKFTRGEKNFIHKIREGLHISEEVDARAYQNALEKAVG